MFSQNKKLKGNLNEDMGKQHPEKYKFRKSSGSPRYSNIDRDYKYIIDVGTGVGGGVSPSL